MRAREAGNLGGERVIGKGGRFGSLHYACARGCDAPAGGVKSIEAGGDTSDVEADGRGDEPLGRPMPPLQVTWRSKQLIGRGEL